MDDQIYDLIRMGIQYGTPAITAAIVLGIPLAIRAVTKHKFAPEIIRAKTEQLKAEDEIEAAEHSRRMAMLADPNYIEFLDRRKRLGDEQIAAYRMSSSRDDAFFPDSKELEKILDAMCGPVLD